MVAAGCTAAPGSASPRSSFPTRVPTDAPPFAKTPPVFVLRGRSSSRMPVFRGCDSPAVLAARRPLRPATAQAFAEALRGAVAEAL